MQASGWGSRGVAIAMAAASLGIVLSMAPSTDGAAASGGLGADVKARYSRPTEIPFPPSNPYSLAKAELGKVLFFDTRLSKSRSISCASCHNASFGWEDGRPTGVGEGGAVLGRASQTVQNLAWSEVFFWDGRASTLEEQAAGPITAPSEMGSSMEEVEALLETIPWYQERFQQAFPGEGITPDNIVKALATFQRTIVSAPAPFDRWIEGDESAISESAKRGFALFNGKARCAQCHTGWNFTDSSFHDIGLKTTDIGRGEHLPEIPIMRHAFKTPGLRNIEARAPYMHNGSVATLEAVIDHYDRGFEQRPSLSPEMQELGLTDQEKADLVEFMKSLTSKDVQVAVPRLP